MIQTKQRSLIFCLLHCIRKRRAVTNLGIYPLRALNDREREIAMEKKFLQDRIDQYIERGDQGGGTRRREVRLLQVDGPRSIPPMMLACP